MIFKQHEINELNNELKNKKIVFTNGCFDLLHRGHIDYLSKSRKLGDVLVVGLNTDSSVKRLKGNSRPLLSEEDRAFMLDNIKAVDYVIMFKEDTPLEIIKDIEPDVLVKGRDYENKEVVGQDFVEKKGGKVVLIDFIQGYSTTNLITKIKNME